MSGDVLSNTDMDCAMMRAKLEKEVADIKHRQQLDVFIC